MSGDATLRFQEIRRQQREMFDQKFERDLARREYLTRLKNRAAWIAALVLAGLLSSLWR